MNTTVNFIVEKKQLLNSLKQLQKLEKSSRKNDSTLEVTIYDGYLQLVIPGIQLKVQAETEGSAKFTIRLWYFANLVNAEKANKLHSSLTENQLKLRSFTFGVLTTFIKTDDNAGHMMPWEAYTQSSIGKNRRAEPNPLLLSSVPLRLHPRFSTPAKSYIEVENGLPLNRAKNGMPLSRCFSLNAQVKKLNIVSMRGLYIP